MDCFFADDMGDIPCIGIYQDDNAKLHQAEIMNYHQIFWIDDNRV